MKRVVSVWLPEWPLDRLRRVAPAAVPGDRPFALVVSGAEAGGRGQLLHAVNAPARRAGLTPGLALADARAAVPGLVTRPAEMAADRLALRRLALWVGRYGPRRNVDGTDGLWIDVSGVPHLFGGEARLLADLVGRLARAGITARAGLAGTVGAAFALARYGVNGTRVFAVASPGGEAKALHDLPVEALRLDADAVVLLRRLGLRRIGQLYDLPRPALARRFRDGLGRARTSARRAEDLALGLIGRLDAALGSLVEPRRPLVEPPAHRVLKLFVEPLLSHEGLATAVRQALETLVGGLAERGAGVRRLRLLVFRSDGTMAAVAAGTGVPSVDAGHLFGLLAERMAAIDAGYGLDAIAVEAVRTEAVRPEEVALSARLTDGARKDPAVVLDRLAGRLGAARVVRLRPVASHWPERSEATISVLADQASGQKPESKHESTGESRGESRGENTGAAWLPPASGAARPAFVLPAPEPIAVMAEVPDGPPLRFTWRRVGHRIAKAEGPERIEPEWWGFIDPAAAGPGGPPRPRDYYQLEDDQGGRFWVFREGLFEREAEDGAPAWFLHGVFA